MQIYVNEQKLDAKLSSEKNLQEVYDELESWTQENQRYILGISVNHREVAHSELSSIDVHDVDRLDLKIGDEAEVLLSTLFELDQYIDQVGTFLFGKSAIASADLQKLAEGIEWMEQVLDSATSLLHMDAEKTMTVIPVSAEILSLQNLLADISQGPGETADKNDIDSFLDKLRALKAFVMKLRSQIVASQASPEEMIAIVDEFEKAIPDFVDSIIQINIEFQSGKDKEALAGIETISEQMNYYLSSLHAAEVQFPEKIQNLFHPESETSYSDQAQKVMELLLDFSTALEEADLVTAGDILEYELAEEVRLLGPYLPEIRQFLLAGKEGA